MSREHTNKLKQKVRLIPDLPGVYLMKNGRGKVLYVGKAKSLSGRVRDYFQSTLGAKTRSLMNSVESIDYIATDNEVDALVLECNLIKEYRPRYNIRLKDDKSYPFIKLTLNESFPRLLLVRRVENDGADYFGPYTDVRAVRRTLMFIGSIFPLRKCTGKRFSTKRKSECLNYHLKHCLAPCTGRVCEKEYGEIVEQVRLFLKGRNDELYRSLRDRMKRLAAEKRYEEAALVRDHIETFDKIAQRRLVVSPGGGDEDFIAIAREKNRSCGVVMKIREGKVLGSEAFIIPANATVDDKRVFSAFFKLYYHSASDVPRHIYAQISPYDVELHEKWLTEKSGHRVTISMPKRGKKKKLVGLANKNASIKIMSMTQSSPKSPYILRKVKETLGMTSTPLRIEAYDISNIHGAEAVGSMVTFYNGRPLKKGYRHFKIREVAGINDFAMLEEVLKRRLGHLREGRERHPDLILVDGGRGQLTSARKAVDDSEMGNIPIIGLAKRNEEIYLEDRKDVLKLQRRNDVLRFLQSVRDEAHRFAIEYHRKLRRKKVACSELDNIPGIGEKRKILLLVEFGSIEGLKTASIEDIASVPGIGEKIAQEISKHLHKR